MIPVGVMSSYKRGEIVTDGLVLNLDAGDSASYPGSGTVWYDLVGLGGTASFNGTPSYWPGEFGGIFAVPSTQQVSFYAPNLTTHASIEMWCKPFSFTETMFCGWNIYDVYCYAGTMIGYNTGNSDVYGINSSQISTLGLLNNWKHYVFEMRSDVPYTNNKIYVNAQEQVLAQQRAAEDATRRTFNGGLGRFGGWRNSLTYRMPMDIGTFRVYNRALSPQEITQNFDALRGRFGV